MRPGGAIINRGRIVARGPVTALLGGQGVVRVRVPSPVEAIRVLEGLPGITRLEANETNLDVRGVPSEVIVKKLVMEDIVPSEVTKVQTDLETLFLDLIQQPA